jgi:hypothetical protein
MTIPSGAAEFVPYLGLAENDASLAALLARFGSETRSAREEGVYAADISHLEVGVNFAFEDERMLSKKEGPLGGIYLLMAIHLYSKGHERSGGYAGIMPHGIQFSDSRAIVRKKLEAPTKSGGGVKLQRRMIPVWDSYRYDRCELHLTYSEDLRRLVLVTLLSTLGR